MARRPGARTFGRVLQPNPSAGSVATSGEPPRCRRCGAPIGVYEPLVYEAGDGAPVRSAFLRLPPELGREPQRAAFFHVACHAAAPAAAPA
jgi:hypothetical protein